MRCECGADPVSESSDRMVFCCGTIQIASYEQGVAGWLTQARGQGCHRPKIATSSLEVKSPYAVATEIANEFLESDPEERDQLRSRIFEALVLATVDKTGRNK